MVVGTVSQSWFIDDHVGRAGKGGSAKVDGWAGRVGIVKVRRCVCACVCGGNPKEAFSVAVEGGKRCDHMVGTRRSG